MVVTRKMLKDGTRKRFECLQPVLVWDNVPQNFQCPGRPGRDMSWTCPGHSIQDYIYILHMYTNYKILINIKLLISQDTVIGFVQFWTFLKALVLIYLCINL